VTSQIHTAEISHACETNRIKLLQKNVASFIPIQVINTSLFLTKKDETNHEKI
jgi:hypothetical protein